MVPADDVRPAEEPEADDVRAIGPRNPRKPPPDRAARLTELLRAVDGSDSVLVLTHDNPDPDAIASAAGLAYLIERASSIPAVPAFGGIIGRAENRALMEELAVPFERIENREIGPGTAVALVDTQPGAGNNSLPAGRRATVVIDHHPEITDRQSIPFVDVRPEYGACASMVVEYLRVARVEPERPLATALFYGIQSETMDLGRDVSEADIGASLYLYPRSLPAAVSRIRHARVPRGFFRSLREGLERAWSRGGVVCVPAGRLDYPDLVAQLADFFMRVQGVEWVIAAGHHGDSLHLSVRTFDPTAHAGELVQSVVGDRGAAGGHGELAGARIDLGSFPDEDRGHVVESLFEEFGEALGVNHLEVRALVQPVAPPAGEERAADSGRNEG